MLEQLLEIHRVRIERMRARITRAEQGLSAVHSHLFQHLQRLDLLSNLMGQLVRRRDTR